MIAVANVIICLPDPAHCKFSELISFFSQPLINKDSDLLHVVELQNTLKKEKKW